ncbi:hypothetical protein CYFUS_005365 [Cystobacter fuscus]|uniref:Pentapeptide repeat-containing protein n=1 Tax=Cystobacter fuscus TaxID=43 RepID=A0A250J8S1_9BACT|nr:hypothetical protein [Cystobacter fuscus]ATB39917.1 hypothetical protein CYFUS_005365 [Cystobacter fuscus]
MHASSNVHYEERVIEGERLELTDKEAIYWLGPNLTLRRCTVVLGVAERQLVPMWGRLIDCTITAKREVADQWLTSMQFEGCRFVGKFTGIGFGQRAGVDRWWEHGGIANCDFSEARLDECVFHSCDMRTIRLPKWPCFTILEPIKHGRELLSVPWPGDFVPVVLEGPLKEQPTTSAVTLYAPAEAKRSRATLEEFKAAVGRFDFIVR